MMKRKTKLQSLMTMLKSKSLSMAKRIGHLWLRLKDCTASRAFTRKSQAVAQQRKDAEAALQKSDAVLQAMLQKAEERYKPYSEVDMLVASKTMDDADFAALRKEAQQAHDDVRFLKRKQTTSMEKYEHSRRQPKKRRPEKL